VRYAAGVVTLAGRTARADAPARARKGIPRPPGPRGLPGLGALFDFQPDPLGAMTRYVAEYGDFVYFHLAGVDVYLAFHPEDVQSVLIGEHARFMKDDLIHELSRFVGRGLLISEGAFWRRQRKIAAPSFSRTHVTKFADTMVRAAIERRERLRVAGPRDVHGDMMVLTLEIVLQTMFGAASIPDIESVGGIVETMTHGFAETYLTWRRLVPRWMRPRAHAELDDARARLDAILYPLIQKRRREGGAGDDLLGRLLAAKDDEGARMSDEQLRDEVATVFLAGHETTALALSYALWLLARHPEAQARLFAEVSGVLGSRPATLEDLPRLPFCDAVVKEAMRLYPPAYLIGREALEEVEIAGYRVPRGAQVLTPIWVVQRDARWFPDPLAFRPERWLDGLEKRLHRFAYFPFGGGARICVGNHFAMLESVLVLATLVQGIEVTPDPTHELDLLPAVTLRPKNGVRVTITPR
jgi:cytochrome P450